MNFTFNIAKGRAIQLYENVRIGDPITSALVLVVLQPVGLESDPALIAYRTLGDLLAGPNQEPTNQGYARKVIDLGLPTPVIDDDNERVTISLPELSWSGVDAGTDWAKALMCYDPDRTSGSDSDIIPLTAHDWVVSPDGSQIILQLPNGFFKAYDGVQFA